MRVVHELVHGEPDRISTDHVKDMRDIVELRVGCCPYKEQTYDVTSMHAENVSKELQASVKANI